jgi:hypothetical protein
LLKEEKEVRKLLTLAALVSAVFMFVVPGPASAQVSIGLVINTAPPMLPYYTPPPAPAPNYLWTPGYWAWGPAGYYWVPGTWVPAPQPGLYWTPGYWSWNGVGFVWNPGYWGPQVGFYGGIDYGAGYFGTGYVGGMWQPGGVFAYNTAVTPVNTTVIHNVYINRTVINRTVIVRRPVVAYNGGPGGVRARPTAAQLAAARQKRLELTPLQREHIQLAREDRTLYASVNHGKPPVLAARKPFTPRNKPPNFKPLTAADRRAAAAHIVKPAAARKAAAHKAAAMKHPAEKPAAVHKAAAMKHPAEKPAAAHKAAAMKHPAEKPAAAHKPAAMKHPAEKPAAAHKAAAGAQPEPKKTKKPNG